MAKSPVPASKFRLFNSAAARAVVLVQHQTPPATHSHPSPPR
ncbi:hypothetical protein [Streptomyces griseus]